MDTTAVAATHAVEDMRVADTDTVVAMVADMPEDTAVTAVAVTADIDSLV
jgi:hypothetical protein